MQGKEGEGVFRLDGEGKSRRRKMDEERKGISRKRNVCGIPMLAPFSLGIQEERFGIVNCLEKKGERKKPNGIRTAVV